MIQNIASALATGLPQATGGTTTGAAPGSDFAALLAVTVPPKSAIHMGEAASAPVAIMLANETQPLPDALQDAQDGMTAPVRQAAATTPVDRGMPVIMRPVSLPSASVNPPVSALPTPSRIALTVGLVTMPQGPLSDAPLGSGQLVPAPVTRPAAASSGEPRDGTEQAPSRTVDESLPEAQPALTAAPRPRAALADAATRQVDGKDGKTSGKMLPSMEKPDHLVATGASSAPPVLAAPVQEAAAAAPVLLAVQPAPMAIPGLMPESPPSEARTEAAMPRIVRATVIAERPLVTPAVRNLRFEPIEIVRLPLEGAMPSPSHGVAPVPTIAVPAASPAAAAPAVSATPEPAALAPGRMSIAPGIAAVGQPATTPDARPVRPMPERSPEAPAATQAEPLSTSSSDRPAALSTTYPTLRSGTAAERPARHGEGTVIPSTPPPGVITARQPRPAPSEETPPAPRVAGREAPLPPLASERRPVTSGAPAPDPALVAMPGGMPNQPGVPAAAPALASEAPQDFDTLVARVADAREAAQPHVVRTAFEHAEFGRVAMQIQPAEGGLSVTLSSRDADFAPAVQAAAASVASGSTGPSDQPRQDAPPQQQGQGGQASAQAQPGFGQNGGQQARADASGQQQRRDSAALALEQDAQQPGTPARPRGEQRQGGVYA